MQKNISFVLVCGCAADVIALLAAAYREYTRAHWKLEGENMFCLRPAFGLPEFFVILQIEAALI